ncbi:bifunctional DNA primase/polymerase [Agrobacterium sp. S2/73]|uniref:bifunctional DNA primase/polymerase n=1 Tax=unclassified Agrobacterium TaxID=2632611 RepID=UPI001ADD0234|nr:MULTISPECIES: bifunctional DNA primase/polymerase [unclassified Agrobacterium]MBO9108917.1 bifunctional DNA primase/polymerase [Agrobacterium sp. S2/73]QXZ73333.1 bifunctional DNA primase/polymerase [Agrobacterium sp. S7/73]
MATSPSYSDKKPLISLELAQHYVAQGWPVFPCRSHAEEHGDQATGEVITLGEKTPLTPNGFKGATRFPRIIERWWSDWPDAAVGLPTGEKTGFFALDIDNKPGGANGFDWLAEMEAEHGPLPDTARVTSPNGGLHIYFKYVVGTRNRGALGAGVDIRSEGGYVLAAGSTMANGRSYKWETDTREIADAPAWLLDLLLPKSAPAHTQYSLSAATNNAYVDAAVDRELADLAGAPMGSRNNALNDAAFSIGTIVGAGALGEAEARALLQDVARGWGRDWSRCCKTIENGLKAGIQNPRHIPEPEFPAQDNTRLVDITRMIQRGLEKGRLREQAARVDADLTVQEDVPQNGKDIPEREAASPVSDIEPANDNTPQSPITATAFKWIDPKTLPRREFAYGSHFIRKYVSVTVSPGGLGKTSASIAEGLAMVSGRALLGIKPPKRLRTWIFNAEDPRDEMERRIMAACIHYKLKPADLEGHLFLDSGREQELVVAIDDKKAGVRIQQPIVEAVVEQIERNGIDVMIVDPFVSTHGVNENDNGAIDKVAKLWAQIADYTNCSIDIVHHLRKVADREATVEDARGAVSLIGAARSVRVLNRMSEEQAGEAGINKEDRFGYFYTTYGKSNLTPLSHRAEWRHLVSTPLGNGTGLAQPQDFAPVVTEWHWPSAEDVAGDLTEDQRASILAAVSASDYKKSPKAKNWVGAAVAYAVGLDLDDNVQRKRASSLVTALMREGALVEREERDPVRRELAVFVRAA